MSTRIRVWRRAAHETLLTVAAAIGVLCAVAALAAVLLEVRPLVFRSGSMAPEIPVGSLALARSTPAEEIVVGDVISVFRADGARVTHRVVSAEPVGGSAVRFVLQGDANADRDAVPYVVDEADRVFWSQPGWGRVVREAQSTPVVFTAGVVVGALLVTSFRRRPQRSGGNGSADPPAGSTGDTADEHTRGDTAPGRRTTGAVGTTAMCVLAAALAVSTVAPRVTGTMAAFADLGETSSQVTTTTVRPVTNLRCNDPGLTQHAQIRWNAPDEGPAPTGYRVEIRTNTTNALVTQITMGASARQYQIQPNLLALGTFRVYVISLYGQSWRSQQPSIPAFVRINVLTGLASGCG
ncbi:hypothetical protein G1H11_00975 [Phytoactinopolyspora alkaliphila]|uniref:Fibronectin type-III domain-containing protein n=1 Tax=Phytoactinopolyspora alkaliphila TaxID=1783498 RepID=A0A6N9YFY4_9ACTN|nr:hypothetical protein [Phytoactinopolyspora alkaliphila]NED93884.1 hypothetical protein [Phytoactinopolyspora alkaliphila]